jgi:formate dehydrogenase subunit delta
MANDIAAFFEAETDRAVAAKDMAHHLKRFWTPGMRETIGAHVRAGGEGLSELGRAAVMLLGSGQQKG